MSVPLFLQDYQHLHEDHFEYDTKNRSFIRMYHILKKMGIKNNKFHLVLLDVSLRGVDPYNLPNDDMELKLRIVRECKLNPWYFFRNCCRVPVQGADSVPFKLSRANLALIWLFFCHIDHLLIMPRQQGKTVSTTAIFAYLIYVAASNCNISMLTKDAKLRKENVERLKDTRDAFPEWMIHKQRSDIDSREEVSYTVLSNKYQTYVAQMSVTGAEKLGRGMTTVVMHWDEIAFFNNIRLTYPIAISTTTAAIESAKQFGAPYGNILTTTAGKLNTDEGRFTHDLICDSLLFTELLYDSANLTDLGNIVASNSKRRMIYSEFSYKQLGKSEEWFELEAAKRGDADVIDRDLLNKWTFGSQQSPIDKDLLDKVYSGRREPDYVQKIDEFIVRWYIPKSTVLSADFNSIPIIIGLDASSNVGRDFTSFVFMDARTLRPIATCSCNTTSLTKVCLFIIKWLKLDNVVFIPERNHVGSAIVNHCCYELDRLNICPFFKIYNEIIQNWRLGTNKLSLSDITRPGAYEGYHKYFGFKTTSDTRPFMYKTVFRRALELSGENIADKTLINQIGGLTIKNGRIDHGDGKHDDAVIAYLLASYFLFYGENLDMYTFNKGNTNPLLVIDTKGQEVRPGVFMSQSEIEKIQFEIRTLTGRIKTTYHETSKLELLHKLRELKQQLPEELKDSLPDKETISQMKRNYIPDEYRNVDMSTRLQNYLGGGL